MSLVRPRRARFVLPCQTPSLSLVPLQSRELSSLTASLHGRHTYVTSGPAVGRVGHRSHHFWSAGSTAREGSLASRSELRRCPRSSTRASIDIVEGFGTRCASD